MTSKQFITLIVVLIVLGGSIVGTLALKPTVQQIKEVSLGASPGSTFNTDFLNHNGVIQISKSFPMLTTGSTTCSYLVTATSTFPHISVNIERLATSTQVEIGTATTAFATTTSLGKGSFATGGGTLVASTSPYLVATPGTYINVKIGGGQVAGTVTPLGTCKFQGNLLK